MDVSGDTLAVSAFGEGRVYIFDRNPQSASQWDLDQVIQPSEAQDTFGLSLDIDHDRLVVGSADFRTGFVGAAFVFQRREDQWRETAKLTAPEPTARDLFGAAVAFFGQDLLVGASHLQLTDPGVVYSFRSSGDDLSQWALTGAVTAPQGASGDAFGGGIDVWNDMFAVTSSRASDLQGAAYLFVPEPTASNLFLACSSLFLALAHRDRRTVALAQK